MDWRNTTMARYLEIFALVSTLPLMVSAAHAARVVDPDQKPAISRFGEFTDRNGRVIRAEDQMRVAEDEEVVVLRSPASAQASARTSEFSDKISTHAAARARPAGSEAQPMGTTRRNGVQEVAVIAGDLGFFPRTVFVTQDIPVRMFVTGASKNALCIMMDSFNVRKQVKSQAIEEVSFTPERPGKFRFYCPVNGAEGFVVVREFGRGEDS